MNQGNLYIISAPSGAGKTSLVKELIATIEHLIVSVSHTTRKAREGEIDGKDYFFVNLDTFHEMEDQNEFLESALVFGNFYGTAQRTVKENLTKGLDVILEIDWQGARQIRQIIPQTRSIFILPPSIEILRTRLKGRNKDDEDVIAKRMQSAVTEMNHYLEFDYVVVNDDFNHALRSLSSIILANRLTQERQACALQPLLLNLLT